MLTAEFMAAALLAAGLVGLSKGGLPMLGMLAVPVLALVMSPVLAAGLLLPVYVVSDMFGLWAWRGNVNRKVLAMVIPGAAAGIFIGWATASYVPESVVTLLIGVIGFTFAMNALLRGGVTGAAREPRLIPGLFWGSLTGFTSFVSHSGAPPWQVYTLPLRMEKAVFAGTSTVAFAIINLIKLIPYAHLGQLGGGHWGVAAILTLPAVAGVFIGRALVRVIPTDLFFRLVIIALALISGKLIIDGLRGLSALWGG